MPRPRKNLPAGALDTIRVAAADGLRETDIARQLGMDFRTWRRIRDENPDAKAAWEEGRACEEDELVGLLMKKARDGDGASAMFLLKTRHGYREQAPVENNDKPSVTINLPGAMSPEEYERLVNVTPEKRHIEGGGNG